MRILVLGGSGLTGTAIVEEAVARGHEVASVQRGERPGGVTDGVIHVQLDRVADGHARLVALEPDAVIDVCGYVPAVVADALYHVGVAAHWTYISSASVYADGETHGQREDAPLHELPTEIAAAAAHDRAFAWGNETYGGLKVACERLLTEATDGRAALLRPVVIAGAYDHTWRFPYWVERCQRGGRVLAPRTEVPGVGCIDVSDLAGFALDCAEQHRAGPFTLAPDHETHDWFALLDGCTRAAQDDGTHIEVEWVDEQQLVQAGVEPWRELPFWLPRSTGSTALNMLDASHARAAGFDARPFSDTARAVARWLGTTPEDQWPDRSKVITPLRESQLVG